MSTSISNPKFANIQLKPKQIENPSNFSSSTPPRPRPRTRSGHFSLLSPSSTSTPEELLAKEAIRIIRAKYASLMSTLFTQENLVPVTFYTIILEAHTASRDVLQNVIKSQPVYEKYSEILEGYLKEDFFVEVSRLVQISTKIVDRCRSQYISQLESFLIQYPEGVEPSKLNEYDSQLQQSIEQNLSLELQEKVRIGEPSEFHCQCLQHYINKYSNWVCKANQEKLAKNQPKQAPPPPPPAELKPHFQTFSNFPIEQRVAPVPPPKDYTKTSTILQPPYGPPEANGFPIFSNVTTSVATGSVKCVAPNKPPRSPRSPSSMTHANANHDGPLVRNSYVFDQNFSLPISAPPESSTINFASLPVSQNQREHMAELIERVEKVGNAASVQTKIKHKPPPNVAHGKAKKDKSKKKPKESKSKKEKHSVPKGEQNMQLVVHKPSLRKNCLIL